jgi:hypothetical protein
LPASAEVGYRVNIGAITNDQLTVQNCLFSSPGAIKGISRAYANDVQFSWAIAIVIPDSACFLTINDVLLPAHRAAGSATAGRSTWAVTKSDDVKF